MPTPKKLLNETKKDASAKSKAPRTKTINTSLETSREYLDRCLRVCAEDEALSLRSIKDRTLFGDCFDILPRLPKESFDLAIIDPPYNIRKSFNGNVFSKKSLEEYEEYTRSWLTLVAPLMKKNALLDFANSPSADQ